MWTRFMDMHSGGYQKLDQQYIYIEASRDEAELVFQNRFSRNPHRVTCTCCGSDYGISESEDLAQLTAYDRHCRYDEELEKYVDEPYTRYGSTEPVILLKDYMKRKDVLFVHANDIKPEERKGELHEEGYVWKGEL